jgi:WD40 repeat protein
LAVVVGPIHFYYPVTSTPGWSETVQAIREDLASRIPLLSWQAHEHLLESDWGKSPGAIELWDVASGKKTRTVPIDAGAWILSPDGRLLISRSADSKTLNVCDVASGKVVAELGHTAAVTALVFSPDGTKVATATQVIERTVVEPTIHVWELSGGTSAPAPNQ